MKRFVAIFLLCVALVAPAVAAPVKSKAKAKKTETTITIPSNPADGPMGIGLFLGQPTGIDFQMDLSRTSWADFKAAWNLAGGNSGFSILLQGNYEYAFPGMVVIESASFTPFVGFGAIVNVYDGGAQFGARVPAGISYRFRNIPIELFLELGLDLYLFPSLAPGGSGGLGVRYRF
ncbi:MAG: hypothetical protein A2Y38_06080 [Spirochaetes bacterium GWB1_59_5]|nr:MAG: hypothetical protein A2Y38_06080 [Spirochaetes bacterium GWB1_59_5]